MSEKGRDKRSKTTVRKTILGTTRLFQTTAKTTTKQGKREYMRQYMKAYRDLTRKRKYSPRKKPLS